MEAAAHRVLFHRREVLGATVLAALAAALLVGLGPPGGDAPAHLYRVLLVHRGVYLWDNLWYGGQYPLASYSLLYYLPAAAVGNVPLVFVAVLAAAALFASLVVREWGIAARWPARAFGLLASGPLFTGTYAYALGLAALLGVLRALQARRTWIALLCAALTLGFSPLAFVFLCLVLLAVFLARRRLSPRAVALAVGLALLAGIELAGMWLFPDQGVYPFSAWDLVGVLAVSAAGTALAVRVPGANVIAAFFSLWGLASLVAFFVATPIGDNLTRLRDGVFPLMLLSALLARFRPRWLAGLALFFAFAYNVVPYLVQIPDRLDERPAQASFWAPALAFLRAHSPPGFRVEVVPTADHWEAYWLPRAGFALARGWYRQLDAFENPLLYRRSISSSAYRAWLRSLGVRYVLLPRARRDELGAQAEAHILRSGRSGLFEVERTAGWTIYELPLATPILTGPGDVAIMGFGHARIAGRTTAPGDYRLRVRYTPYWQVRRGALCLAPAPDGMTRLTVTRPGSFLLVVGQEPSQIVRSFLEADGHDC